MIARKITYHGNFTPETIGDIFNITRNNEITGLVKGSGSEIELLLEGDPAQIKLTQHQIERKAKSNIKDKTISNIPYQYYVGVTLLT